MSKVWDAALVGIVLVAAPGGFAGAQEITLTDLAGRAIELDGPAERIVTLPVPMAASVIALDQSPDRLVAIHPESELAIDHDILGVFFPQAKEIDTGILADGARRGHEPDVAAIEALEPDLVIQWAHGSGLFRSEGEKTDPLVEAGLNVALIVRGADDEYMREALTLMGDAIGKPERAEMLIAWRDAVSAEIQAGIDAIPEEERPKAAYLFYSVEEFWTEGTGTFGDWQLRHVGALNAAADIESWGEVSGEQIQAWDPDVIFISTFEPDAHVDRIQEHEMLGETTAAQTKRVYQIPLGGYRWDPGSPESPLAWMWYAEVLHPDAFDFDLRAEIEEWYPKLYGHSPTDQQIDQILQLDMNRESAGYDRFAG